MTYYKPGKHIKLNKDDALTRISKKIAPFIIGVLAVYGFADICLRANGL